jgi:N-acetylglutamate synthase-like GNAT family acetyltransferase
MTTARHVQLLSHLRTRAATPDDVGYLFRLSQEFVASGEIRDRPRSSFETQLADFLVAEHSGGRVGCAAVRRIGDTGSDGVLYNVCVDPACHGSGVGVLLVESAVALAARLGISRLFAATTRADEWIASRGFERVRHWQVPQSWLVTLDAARHALLYVRPVHGLPHAELLPLRDREGRHS